MILTTLSLLAAAHSGASCVGSSTLRSFGAGPDERSFIWTATIFDPLYFPSYEPLDYEAPLTGGLTASFWAAGLGDPDPGEGYDNGSFDPSGSLAYGVNVAYQVYYAAQLDADWTDPMTDNCNGPNACTCLLLEDVDPTGRDGFFALVAAKSDSAGDTSFHLAGQDPLGNAQPIVLRPIPPPTVTAVNRPVPDTVEVSVTVARRNSGVYEAVSGAGCSCGPTSFLVYEQVITRSADWTPPTNRDLAMWTLASPAGGGSQTATPVDGSITVSVNCPTPVDERIYLAARLLFDSDFSTAQVSANSIPIDCDPSAPGDPVRVPIPSVSPRGRKQP